MEGQSGEEVERLGRLNSPVTIRLLVIAIKSRIVLESHCNCISNDVVELLGMQCG